jgi:eukaryotic-like serine/threonine-protein kinase
MAFLHLHRRDCRKYSTGDVTERGSGVVKLLDFGLVKEFEVAREITLTDASIVVGTPQYMAPESLLTPESVDARADVYALGAVAYYLLAGSNVFEGKSIAEVCSQHLYQEPQPLSSRGIAIPADLEAVVLACLNKDPNRRPQSAAELRRRVEACSVDLGTAPRHSPGGASINRISMATRCRTRTKP